MAEPDSLRERAGGRRVGRRRRRRRFNADPGRLLSGRAREIFKTWPDETEVTIPERHYTQHDIADEVGAAIAEFVGRHWIESSLRAL